MKILLINGSPRGEGSNSLKLAHAFIEGLGEDNELQTFTLAKMRLEPCRGCFSCWNRTPGKCVIADDMQGIIEAQIRADLIVWSFPLYYFSVPGILKNMIDRQLPMNLPFMSDKEGTGSGSHDARYDMSGKRHVLISTCGFYSAEKNYDSVLRMFDHFLGQGNYETIFCGQGELFHVPELKKRTGEYLSFVKIAGKEYIGGGISAETRNCLDTLLYPRDVFERMADSSWGIDRETGEKMEKSLSFTRQMAALYNKNAYDGKDRILEICYTDLGKTYQIGLTAGGSRVTEGNALPATTRVETPWEVWQRIARGEIRGDVALAEGQYRVTGDFSLMIGWDRFFLSTGAGNGPAGSGAGGSGTAEKAAGSGSGAERGGDQVGSSGASGGPTGSGAGSVHNGSGTGSAGSSGKQTKPQMTVMLAAWILFWMAVSVNPFIGGAAVLTVLSAAAVFLHRKMIYYDFITFGCVELLSLLAVLLKSSVLPVTAGYAVFGLLWLVSSFTREPLCAAYVKYDYGGDKALGNPIFMKTNRILAAAWGILYLLIAIWSGILLRGGHTAVTQIINNAATILMGAFTVWFQKWYPAHVAATAWKAKN